MVKLIDNEAEYKKALSRLCALMDLDLSSNENASNEFDILGLLVENYEKQHYPVPPPEPIAAIKFRMEQSGMSEVELNKILGRKADILSGKRKLTLNMIRKLHDYLHIPAEILIRPY